MTPRLPKRHSASGVLALFCMAGLLAGLIFISQFGRTTDYVVASTGLIMDRAVAPSTTSSQLDNVPNRRNCPSTCKVNSPPSAPVNPPAILAGETISVSIPLQAVCAGLGSPARIVFVVDPDSQTTAGQLRDVQDIIRYLVDQLDLENTAGSEIAIVEVGGKARTVLGFSRDARRIKSAISRLRLDPDQNLSDGLEEAHWLFASTGLHSDCSVLAGRFVVLSFSSEVPAVDCASSRSAVNQLKHLNTQVLAVCMGRNCNSARCLRNDIASDRKYFFDLRNARHSLRYFYRILDEVINITLKNLLVIEVLSPSVEYLPRNVDLEANPELARRSREPDEVSDDGRRLLWKQNFVPKDGLTLTYHVRPKRSGWLQINKGAKVTFEDNQGRKGSHQLQPSNALILGDMGRPAAGVSP